MTAPRFISDLAGTRRSQFRILPAGISGPPNSGTHLIGELHMDSRGSLWRCIGSGAPGIWINAADVAEGLAPVLVAATPTVLDSADLQDCSAARWAVTATKGSLVWLVEVVGVSNEITTADARPTSLQLGSGTVDVVLVVDTAGGDMRLVVTAATDGWSVAWKRIYNLPAVTSTTYTPSLDFSVAPNSMYTPLLFLDF